MSHILPGTFLAALLALPPRVGAGGAPALSLGDVLALARARAPSVLAERARIEEARGRLIGVSRLLHENPVLEGGFARRRPPAAARDRELRLGLHQLVELGGERGARIGCAKADLSRADAAADDEVRRALRRAAAGYYRALHADARLVLSAEAESVAAEILRITERRRRVGDLPLLDENVARIARARARADARAAEAERAAAYAELRISLGMAADEALGLAGDLRDRRSFDLADLLARGRERPDLRALEAERREAEAETRLGWSRLIPDLRVGGAYEEEEATEVRGGFLEVALPLFDRGQGERAEGRAKARRVEIELAAARRSVEGEVRASFEVRRSMLEGVEELEANALPLLEENERMARRSYEAGQIGLTELLTVRREILGTRLEYLDQLLGAAVAGADLLAAAGAWEETPAGARRIPASGRTGGGDTR